MNIQYETERMYLKVLNEKDAPLVLNFYEKNLAEFAKYEPIPEKEVHLLSYQAKNMQYEYAAFCQGKMARYYMFLKDNPFIIIGTISYRNIHYTYKRTCEIGYKLDKDFRHNGYMSEAIDFLDNEIFKSGIHRIEAYILPSNEKSYRMLERIGYEREGLLHDKAFLNGEYKDNYIYARINKKGP